MLQMLMCAGFSSSIECGVKRGKQKTSLVVVFYCCLLLYAGAAAVVPWAVTAFVRRGGCGRKNGEQHNERMESCLFKKDYALSAFNSASKSSNSDSSKVLRSGKKVFCIFLEIFVAR